MKFAFSFNYQLLSATKDTLVITCKGGGAELIPALKGSAVLLVAFLVMLTYTKLSNQITRNKLFYSMLSPFIIFFFIFGVLLFPYQDTFALNESADILASFVGAKHQHWVVAYRYWMNSLFFVFADLWGVMGIGLLFWGLANQVNSVGEAARFYTLYTVGGHIGVVLSGVVILAYTKYFGVYGYKYNILALMITFTLLSLLIVYLHLRLYKGLEHKKDIYKPYKKLSLPLWQSIKHIVLSPYLVMISIMVVGYSVSVNMVDVSWKAILKLQYPESNQYQYFMGITSFATGGLSLFLAFFISGNVIRKLGWNYAAQLTPIVLGSASILFYVAYYIYRTDFNIGFYGATPLMLVVMAGAIHNVACKSMKYCLFDPTKEMAYIPLEDEAKVKGKAAVDVVASRFGKSGSSWIQVILLDMFGSGNITTIIPMLLPFVVVSVLAWLFSVKALNIKFSNMLNKIKAA